MDEIFFKDRKERKEREREAWEWIEYFPVPGVTKPHISEMEGGRPICRTRFKGIPKSLDGEACLRCQKKVLKILKAKEQKKKGGKKYV